MKHNNALLHGCLLAAGLTLLPFAAHADLCIATNVGEVLGY